MKKIVCILSLFIGFAAHADPSNRPPYECYRSDGTTFKMYKTETGHQVVMKNNDDQEIMNEHVLVIDRRSVSPIPTQPPKSIITWGNEKIQIVGTFILAQPSRNFSADLTVLATGETSKFGCTF